MRRPTQTTTPVLFDRRSGILSQAGPQQRVLTMALRSGSALSRSFGYRGYSLGCRVLAPFAASKDIVVTLSDNARFSFPLADGYWSRLLDAGFHYEEELDLLFRHIKDVDYLLLDCGANFGYWSVLASSPEYGNHLAIAVEASFDNAAWLEFNASLNGNRFAVANIAIGETDGAVGQINGHKHEALKIVPFAGGGDGIPMNTIDRLMADNPVARTRPIVVKLDVEGFEIDALNGAQQTLARDAIVICEDHGSYAAHTVTRHLLEKLSLKVFVCDEQTSRFSRIETASEVARINGSLGLDTMCLRPRAPSGLRSSSRSVATR